MGHFLIVREVKESLVIEAKADLNRTGWEPYRQLAYSCNVDGESSEVVLPGRFDQLCEPLLERAFKKLFQGQNQARALALIPVAINGEYVVSISKKLCTAYGCPSEISVSRLVEVAKHIKAVKPKHARNYVDRNERSFLTPHFVRWRNLILNAAHKGHIVIITPVD